MQDEVDGNAVTSLQELIQKRPLLPSELKYGLMKNCMEWKDQVNHVDECTRIAPIHHIALHIDTYTSLLLLNLLTYGNANIDCRAANGKTALILAVEAGNIPLMKTLVAMGANVNLGADGMTALKLAIEKEGGLDDSSDGSTDTRGFEDTVYPGQYPNSISSGNNTHSQGMVHQLKSVGATIYCHDTPTVDESDRCATARFDHNEVAKHFRELNDRVQVIRCEDPSMMMSDAAFDALKALQAVNTYRKSHGSRILCLDGGGVRGLVQIEMLRQIEQRTGKRITKLFDWIVGTSTGGIIALALVYAKLSVAGLQRFYLRLKRSVFSRSGVCIKGNSNQLEWYLKRQLKGTMDSESHPKLVVSAVRQNESGIQLVFFNNCFEDDYSKEEVWKVARYTSAAPLYFTAKDGYLDGALLADNPAEDALTAIQQFYHKRQLHLPISLVVSLGTGINPVKLHKGVNVTTELWKLPSQAFSFMTLLREALMNHQADSNCSSRCIEQGITYVRLNPPLDEEIDSAETDNDKLVNMLWTARQYLHNAKDDNKKRKMDILTEALHPFYKETSL